MAIAFEVHSMALQRRLNWIGKSMEKSIHRLSTGTRVNAAKDDPFRNYEAGRLESEISSKERAKRNALDGASFLQVADGACSEVQNILQKIRELSVQAANDTLSSTERHYLNIEAEDLLKEIDRITASTTFNTKIVFGNRTEFILQRVNELRSKEQGGGTLTADERNFLDSEASKMLSGIDKKADYFSDEGRRLLDWTPFSQTRDNNEVYWKVEDRIKSNTVTLATVAYVGKEVRAGVLHINSGATKVDEVKLSLPEVTARGLGLETLSLTYQNGATRAIDDLDAAISSINSIRTYMGVVGNHMDKQVEDLSGFNIGLSDYVGKIKDTDVAKESTEFAMAQIQQQAVTSILAQCNSRVSRVLEMLAR
jgi:flagellin